MQPTEPIVGVLGAGQLGKMLAQAASEWHLKIHGLDPNPEAPAKYLYRSFTCGDYADYDHVFHFGLNCNLITIEIEHVNTEALKELSSLGKSVHPNPYALEVIKDKGKQKQFYLTHGFPTAPFILVSGKDEIINLWRQGKITLPAVQKSRTAGYDGKGVKILAQERDLFNAIDSPSVIEEMANISKELAVIASRNARGQINCFPVVEMLFNEQANLVENLLCPAQIPQEVFEKCQKVAGELIEKLDLCGVLAVEFFWLKNGEIWINECAPRPHNSGHHTIEACYTSQYQQHLRSILNLHLGMTEMLTPYAMMINLLGDPLSDGHTLYEGFEKIVGLNRVFIHLYGKEITKPFRKMGHVTLLGSDPEDLLQKAKWIQDNFKITSRKKI